MSRARVKCSERYRGAHSGLWPNTPLQQLPSTIVLPGNVPRKLSLQRWMVVVGEALGDAIKNRRTGIGREWVWGGDRDVNGMSGM